MIMTKRNKIAVIGAGYWGKNLIRNFNDLGHLGAICDQDSQLIRKYQKQYPKIHCYQSVSEILQAPEINSVAIATPAITHGKIALQALMSGKHTFVEKPLCLNIEQGEKLREVSSKKNLILMVGHLLLYHPAFETLLEMVRKNKLGKLRYIYSTRTNLGKIRREENALWSFAPHDISMILSLTRRLPKKIIAKGEYYLRKGVADTTLTHMDFGKKLQAHIFVSWLHPYKEQKLIVVGDKAMVVFNDHSKDKSKLLAYNHKARWKGNIPIVSKAKGRLIKHSQEEPLKRECKVFLNCIKKNVSPPSDANEAINVLKVLLVSQKSLDQKKGSNI